MSRLSLLLCVVALLGSTLLAVLFFREANAKKLLEVELAGTTARATRLASDLATANEQNSALKAGLTAATTELAATKEKLSSTELRAAVLDHDLAQAKDQLSVYEQTTRAMAGEVASLKAELADTRATFAPPEAVAELERQLANARHGAAAPTAAGASTAVFASRPGRATVLNVGPSSAFVVLDYGSARGAQLGQLLAVSQGTEIVAQVLISDVRTNFSIAQVQPDTLHGALQKGDLAVLIR